MDENIVVVRVRWSSRTPRWYALELVTILSDGLRDDLIIDVLHLNVEEVARVKRFDDELGTTNLPLLLSQRVRVLDVEHFL